MENQPKLETCVLGTKGVGFNGKGHDFRWNIVGPSLRSTGLLASRARLDMELTWAGGVVKLLV